MPPAPWPGGRAGWAQDCPSQSFATVVPSPWHSRFLPEANSIRQSYVSYAGNRECFFCLLSIPLTKVSGSQLRERRGEGALEQAKALGSPRPLTLALSRRERGQESTHYSFFSPSVARSTSSICAVSRSLSTAFCSRIWTYMFASVPSLDIVCLSFSGRCPRWAA